MKFLITSDDGKTDVLVSEAAHADAAAMMHWGLNTAQEVWDKFKVKIETVIDTVEHGWHSVESSMVEKVTGHELDSGAPGPDTPSAPVETAPQEAPGTVSDVNPAPSADEVAAQQAKDEAQQAPEPQEQPQEAEKAPESTSDAEQAP